MGALVVGGIASIPVAGQDFEDIDTLYKFAVLLPAQQVPVLLGLMLVSRLKGRGTLRDDFGFLLDRFDLRIFWTGPALQMLFWILLVPLTWIGGDLDQQQLIEDVEKNASGLALVLFTIGAVVMAPLVEETLYRGLVLRGLLRRFSPGPAVFISAVIFAGVHYLGDPNTLRSLPALTALGIVLGVVTVRTGNLSQAILIHAGFNLTTVTLVIITTS